MIVIDRSSAQRVEIGRIDGCSSDSLAPPGVRLGAKCEHGVRYKAQQPSTVMGHGDNSQVVTDGCVTRGPWYGSVPNGIGNGTSFHRHSGDAHSVWEEECAHTFGIGTREAVGNRSYVGAQQLPQGRTYMRNWDTYV